MCFRFEESVAFFFLEDLLCGLTLDSNSELLPLMDSGASGDESLVITGESELSTPCAFLLRFFGDGASVCALFLFEVPRLDGVLLEVVVIAASEMCQA